MPAGPDAAELSAEERGIAAAFRIYNNMDETWKADTLGRVRQQQLCDTWRHLRNRCQDMWLEHSQSDALQSAHDRLQETVWRCSRKIQGAGSHIAVAGPCHEEIVDAYERCVGLARQQTAMPAMQPVPQGS